METLPSKTCSKCKQVKPLSEFHKDARSKDGVHSWCRECRCTVGKQRYAGNPEIYRERSREWAACNSSRKRETTRKWIAENRDRKRYTDRLWLINNVERVKDWRRKNRKRMRAYSVKARSTPKGKITDIARKAVYRCFRSSTGKCGRKTFDLLGYTPEELMASLEAKFKPGMSWENHGAWHVDHKRPIASYNFSSVDDHEFKECWSLENLQPLWAKENLSKGARYEC